MPGRLPKREASFRQTNPNQRPRTRRKRNRERQSAKCKEQRVTVLFALCPLPLLPSLLQDFSCSLNRRSNSLSGFVDVVCASVFDCLPQIRKRQRGVASVKSGRVNFVFVPRTSTQTSLIDKSALGLNQRIVDALQLRFVIQSFTTTFIESRRFVREIIDGPQQRARVERVAEL